MELERNPYRIHPLTDVRVESCGCSILAPPWRHPERILDSHVLLLGLKGRVSLYEGSVHHELVPQRLVFLPAGSPHGGLAALDAPARYLWVHFRAPLTLETGGSTEMALLPPSWDLPEGAVQRLFWELLTRAETPDPTGWRVRLGFLELLVALTEAWLTPTPARGSAVPSLVHRVQSQIAEQIGDANLSVKGLAYREGVNPNYLSRQFKVATGVSIGEYIARKRVDRSVPLLETSRLPILRVAESCGFGSDRQFFRTFKEQLGFSPGEFRRLRAGVHVNEG